MLALNETEIAQPLAKVLDEGRRRLSDTQEADTPNLRHLLRQRGERPRRRAAEQCDEFAPLHLPSTSPDYANLGVNSGSQNRKLRPANWVSMVPFCADDSPGRLCVS